MSDSEKTTARNLHEELESLLLEFDRHWHANGNPQIADYVARLAQPVRIKGLYELIKIDLEYQWKRGEHKVLEDYVVEFGQLGATNDLPVDLIREEILCRQRFDHAPSASEIANRFPDQASELRSLFDSSAHGDANRRSTVAKSLETMLGEQQVADQGADADPISSRLAGRFEIKAQIGQGAFATVFRAWDVRLRRPVAVKITREQQLAGSSMRRRFLREAQAAAQLQHPGIVSVYEVGQENDNFFIVQELVQGGTLGDRLDFETVDHQQAAHWMVSICEAIDYAHRCGIVHRDLKPANIMMDRYGNPRITDFGLAARADAAVNLTHDGELLGTPAYMAPEQARGDQANVGAHSDIYSLGVLFYQMLCGRLPFTGRTTAVIHSVIHDEPAAPRRLNSSVSMDAQTICLKAMAKEPSRRYTSAREMADDLLRYTRKEPIRARSIGPFELLTLWCRRQPALALTLLASALVIVAMSVISFNRIRAERNRFRLERDRANASLVQSLTKNAESQIYSRHTGWWDSAMEAIREASVIDMSERDRSRLRELAIELFSDTTPRLQLAETWKVSDAGVTALAMDSDARVAVAGFTDGSGAVVRLDDGTILARLMTGDTWPLEQVYLSDEHGVVIGRTGYRAWSWEAGSLDELSKSADSDDKSESCLELQAKVLIDKAVPAIALSADGTQVALGFKSGAIEVRALQEGRLGELIVRLEGHEAEVLALDFSGDMGLLASASADHTVRIWELGSGTETHSCTNLDPVHTLRFAPGQGSIAFADAASFSRRVWKFSSAPTAVAVIKSPVREVGWLSNGTPVSCEQHGSLVVWSGAKPLSEAGGLGEMYCMSIGPSDEFLLGGYRNGTIRKWKLCGSDVARKFTCHHSHSINSESVLFADVNAYDLTKDEAWDRDYDQINIYSMATNGQGIVFLATDSGRLIRWDDEAHDQTEAALGKEEIVQELVVDPARSLLVSADRTGRVTSWAMNTLEQRSTRTLDVGQLQQIAVCQAAGELIVGGTRGWAKLGLEDLAIIDHQPHFMVNCAVACTADAMAISQPDHSVRVTALDQQHFNLKGDGSPVKEMEFSGDGTILVTISSDNAIRAWDWRAERQLWRLDRSAAVASLAVDPLNRYVAFAVAGMPHCVRIADATTVARFSIHSWASSLMWDPTGKALWIGMRGLYRVDANEFAQNEDQEFELDYPEPVIPGGHFNVAWGVAHSPDNRFIVTTGHFGKIKIWNAETLQLERTLGNHANLVWDAAVSPDSNWLATGSAKREGGDLAFWDTRDWQLAFRMTVGERLIAAVDFHPTRPWLAVGTYDGHVAIVDFERREILQELEGPIASVMDVEFSHDGALLAAACMGDGVFLWAIDQQAAASSDTVSAKVPQKIYEKGERLFACAFGSQDARLAVAFESGLVRFYELPSLNPQVSFTTPYTRCRQVRISDDDRFVSMSSYASGNVVWDLQKLRMQLEKLNLAW